MLKRLIAVLVLTLALAGTGWLLRRRSAPLSVSFAPAVRETLVDTLVTNGKAEPAEWRSIRSEQEGAVLRVLVEKGQRVSAGTPIAELDAAAARAELASAEARIVQAKAELAVLQEGGRAAEISEIEGAKRRAELELKSARRDVESLTRLAQMKAATQQELYAAKDRVAQLQAQIESLETKRRSLVGQADRAAAEARLKSAQAAAELARTVVARSVIRSPMAGVIYALNIHPGSFLQAGDEAARVAQMERMKVLIYVDEPELGRVKAGMPISVTWDAMPNKQWSGKVERAPTEVAPLGTRQVGEAVSFVDNPDRDLLPGTNVNVTVRSQVVEAALTIPKEALRREGSAVGVFLLEGDHVVWRPIQVGVSSITRTQVLKGLKEGDRVALPAERPLKNGDKVRPE